MVLSHQCKPREELRQYAAEALAGLYQGEPLAAPDVGGRAEALRRLEAFDVHRYNEQHVRVSPEGSSRLSPYIRHGLLSLRQVRDSVVDRFGASASRSFVMQLLWRVYGHLLYRDAGAGGRGEWVGSKGLEQPAPTRTRPRGHTSTVRPNSPYGPYCVDESIRQLVATGFLPHTARLWVASFLLHFQKVDWQTGVSFFEEHLLDADPMVNTFWWRWVLGEITGVPYFFTRSAVVRETEGEYCRRCQVYRCPFEGREDAVAERARRGGPSVW